MVEEYQRLGIDLLTALEKLSDFSGGTGRSDKRLPEQTEIPEPSERSIVAQNQAAMAELEKMMAGVR